MWLQAVQLNGSAPSRGSPYPISKCLLHPRFLSSLSPPPPKQMTRQKKTCGYIYLLPRTPRTLPQSYQLVCLGGPVPSPPCTHGSQVTPTLGPNQGNIAKAGLAGSPCQCQGVYPTFPLKILSVFSHQCYHISLFCLRNIGNVHHTLVHADASENRRGFSVN